MAHNVVLFNLGDRKNMQFPKTVNAKKAKYPDTKRFLFASNQVVEFELFTLLAKSNLGFLPLTDPSLQEARSLCASASKIMLCMHGLHDDVQYGYVEHEKGVSTITRPVELANLLLYMLPDRKKIYNIALTMCYGARSQNYQLDHTMMVPIGDLQTSFAYNLYKRICEQRNVRMTARTGALEFDGTTGRSLVQSEAAVSADIDKREFLQVSEIAEKVDKYIALRASVESRVGEGSEELKRKFNLMRHEFNHNPDKPYEGEDQCTIRDFMQIQRAAREFPTSDIKKKYGKFVYTYNVYRKRLDITSKYPAPGVLLYSGPLV